MSVSPSQERLLPSPQDLETAEHALGHYMSELDHLATTVEKELAPISIAEYGRLRDAGLEDALEGPDVSDSELLELIAFTADAVADAETISQQAKEIQSTLLGLLHDRRNPRGAEWDAYRGRIRARHRDRAERD